MTITITPFQVQQIKTFVELHEKMKGSYFWSSPSQARARRSYEEANSMKLEITELNIKAEIKTDCSAKNIYSSTTILVNDLKKDIRALKKLI